MNEFIETTVGDQRRLVCWDVFLDIHAQLADELRARGYAGAALDHAIMECLPHRLALILESTGVLN